MTQTMAIGMTISLLIVAGVVWSHIRKLRMQRLLDVGPEWLSTYSVERYRPMSRLFSRDDFEFLARQPGHTRSISRRLHAERRQIFVRYLNTICLDFERLQFAAKLLVLRQGNAQESMARRVFQAKVEFTKALWTVRARLFLHDLGLADVDVSGLIDVMDNLGGGIRAAFVPQSVLASS